MLDSLPLVGIENKPISKLSDDTIYMKLLKHPGFYLVYELKRVRVDLTEASRWFLLTRLLLFCDEYNFDFRSTEMSEENWSSDLFLSKVAESL